MTITRVTSLLSTMLLASTLGAQKPAPPGGPPLRTFRADSFWVHRWIRGGEDETELFIEPRSTVVTNGVLAVLDLGTRDVTALDATTGKTLFQKAARGAGPGEFKRPALLLSDAERFGVLDDETARLSMFSARGALVWDAPIENAFDVEGGCVLPGARVLLKSSGFSKALVLADSAGRIIARHSLPRDANTPVPPPFAESARVAGPIMGKHCAIVPIFGPHWYSVDESGAVRTHAYVERGDAPAITVSSTVLEKSGRNEIRRSTQTTAASPIASGALYLADTLLVISGKAKRDVGRMLDYYAMPSGRYVYSRRLPMPFSTLAVDVHGRFYGAAIGPDWSMVTAFEPSRTAPPRKPVRR